MGSNSEANIALSKFYNNLTETALFYNHQFYVTFTGADLALNNVLKTNIKGGSVYFDDATKERSFAMYVKSTKIPKIDMTETTVNFLSQKFVLPGGVKYDSTWDVTMVIDNNMDIYNAIKNWQETYASIHNNGGGTHKLPTITAHVHCLDAAMDNESMDFVLQGVYPTKLPSIQMQYENDSKVIEVAFTFVYQAMYYKASIGDTARQDPNPLE